MGVGLGSGPMTTAYACGKNEMDVKGGGRERERETENTPQKERKRGESAKTTAYVTPKCRINPNLETF